MGSPQKTMFEKALKAVKYYRIKVKILTWEGQTYCKPLDIRRTVPLNMDTI